MASHDDAHAMADDAVKQEHGSQGGSDIAIDADSITFSEACETVSVSSNVWRFEKENGRTYHGYRAGVYHYPNDPSEAERLDYQSCVLDFAFDDKLHLAPLSSPRTILDIGTGTGSWAIQMGDAYPDAVIEATDLSPIQPSNVPENVQFIIDDAEEDDWAVGENYYDYIHTRVLMGCFEDFRTIVEKGFKHTKPGGWMESLECMHPPYCDDGTMPDDWPFKEWTQTMDEAAMNANRPLRIATRLKKWYIEAGFVDVQEKILKIPINTWPRDRHLKQLGKFWAENLLAGLQGFSLALFSRVFGWNKTEIEVYLVKVRKSITDNRVHAYTKVYTVWGRKPETSSHPGVHTKPLTDPVNSSQVPAESASHTTPNGTSLHSPPNPDQGTTSQKDPEAAVLSLPMRPVAQPTTNSHMVPTAATESTSSSVPEATDMPPPSSRESTPKRRLSDSQRNGVVDS